MCLLRKSSKLRGGKNLYRSYEGGLYGQWTLNTVGKICLWGWEDAKERGRRTKGGLLKEPPRVRKGGLTNPSQVGLDPILERGEGSTDRN